MIEIKELILISQAIKEENPDNKRISEQCGRIERLAEKVTIENDRLKMVISNPPKFAVGDKVGNLLVTSVRFWGAKSFDILISIATKGVISLLFPRTVKEKYFKEIDDDRKYVYEVFDTEIKKKRECNESELIAIKN